MTKRVPHDLPQYKIEKLTRMVHQLTSDGLSHMISKVKTWPTPIPINPAALSFLDPAKPENPTIVNDPAVALGHILSWCTAHEWKMGFQDKHLIEEFETAIRVSIELFSDQVKTLGLSMADLKTNKDHLFKLISNDKHILSYYLLSQFLKQVLIVQNLISTSAEVTSKFLYLYKKKELPYLFRSNKNIYASTAGEGACIVLNGIYHNLSRESLLSLCDIVHQRCNLLMNTVLNQVFNTRFGLSKDHLLRILTWGDSILLAQGQNSFKAIKLLESLCVASLIERNREEICDNKKFYLGLLEDIDPVSDQFVVDAARTLKDFLDTLHPDLVSQIFGLFRIWGHPVVNSTQGIRKVREVAQKLTMPDKKLAREVLWMFRVLFIKGYVQEHKKWPEVTLESGCSKYITDCFKRGRKLDLYNPQFKLEDMKFVRLNKNFDPDPTLNISSMISDKALSLKKGQLLKRLKNFKNIGSSADRRVILEWLNNDIISAQESLMNIDENGFDDEDLVIGVVPKERELKQDPRLFALLTLPARLYFVITENLIADHFLKYFPQITVTLSGAEQSRLLYTLTKHQRESKTWDHSMFEYTTINIDFEKWNLMMRKELSYHLFQEFDTLLGYTHVISRTHEFFSKSLIYLADEEIRVAYDNRGNLQENEYVWFNHLGGFEGQRQKGWTILTVCLIERSTKQYRLQHNLIGQGDNQVLLVKNRIPLKMARGLKVPDYNSAKIKYDQFKTSFYDICDRAGLPVKKTETWESSHLFAYGKQLFYEGNPLPMNLKRLCRQFPLANEDYPSMIAKVSTIFGAGNAATQSDHLPLLAFLNSLIMGALTISYNLNYSILCNISPSQSIVQPKKTIEWRDDMGVLHKFFNK